MIKKNFLALMLSAVIYTACKQPDDKTATLTTVTQPSTAAAAVTDAATLTDIEWLDSTFDKGSIIEGEKIEIAYRFKNTGEKPLIIKDVRPSCGCTVAEKPLEPIAPGKEGLIKAIFNSQNKLGPNHKTITVIANTARESYGLTFNVTVNKKS